MAVWKEYENWKYEYFPRDEPVSTFPEATEFVELWQKKVGQKTLPAWSDYDWYELEPWWGNLGVSIYQYDPFDYEYILFGTKMVRQYQFDATGHRGSTLSEADYASGGEMSFFQMVADNGYLSRASGNIYWQNRLHVDVTLIIVPLSDSEMPITHSLELMISDLSEA